jgi:hypothetical protein
MIIKELIKNLYNNHSPHESCNILYVDHNYPHTNIEESLLITLFSNIKPVYIVECGSMVGGSAIAMKHALKKIDQSIEIICIDTFTGDVNMWDWEISENYKFLQLEYGIPTIYKRFLANCKFANLQNCILPINCTTVVGIKLLQRLYNQQRISGLPNYIFLDSAHEPEETLIEIKVCWDLLKNNSVLFGDDWSWDSVKNDVINFVKSNNVDINKIVLNKIHNLLNESTIYDDKILVYKNQWVLFK